MVKRHLSRKKLVQAFYSWQVSGNDINEIKNYFLIEQNMHNVDINYFCKIYLGVTSIFNILDKIILPYLSIKLNRLGQIELAILRLSTYELYVCKNIPYKVIIDEAIKLTKIFGAKNSHKFINGVLDKIAHDFRLKKILT